MQQLGQNSPADIGDFAKVFAVITVMSQSVISFFIKNPLSIGQQFLLGGCYEIIKFSAPTFIFGILFSTIRTHPHANLGNYPAFMKNRWHVLFIPTIWWTSIYLVFLPQLQQHGNYDNWQSFCWQFINGNAAPHLWYNTMMLQFIILMPLFWWLARWVDRHPKRGILTALLSLGFEVCWHQLYKMKVYNAAYQSNWYFLDRIFLSFIVFAIAGVLTWKFIFPVTHLLKSYLPSQIICWLFLAYIVTFNFFSHGLPVKLTNAPYYLPSMVLYNLSSIGLIITFACYIQKTNLQWLPFFHWIALYAYRAYLSHIFWLYWCWQLVQFLHIPIIVAFPLLIGLTILLSFFSAWLIHLIWSQLKSKLNFGNIKNG